jgi:hypothetical protein
MDVFPKSDSGIAGQGDGDAEYYLLYLRQMIQRETPTESVAHVPRAIAKYRSLLTLVYESLFCPPSVLKKRRFVSRMTRALVLALLAALRRDIR